MSEKLPPRQIEERSFAIITEILGDRTFPPKEEPVIKRVIHTTADFDYAENLIFSPDAVEKGVAALKNGCHIVADTSMVMAGINKTVLGRLGGQVHCFIKDPDVAAEAEARGVTRSAVSMEKAARLDCPCIFAIGNAPTALLALEGLIRARRTAPVLVIGVPVGFVNVVESKERIMTSGVPFIVARGRKGGSNVAAAVCNALLYQIGR